MGHDSFGLKGINCASPADGSILTWPLESYDRTDSDEYKCAVSRWVEIDIFHFHLRRPLELIA